MTARSVTTMNQTATLFYDIGEPFAAGFFEMGEASPARKFCRAYRRFYEQVPLSAYDPEDSLYPYRDLFCEDYAVNTQFCRQYTVDYDKLREKSADCEALFRAFDKKHGDFLNVEGREKGTAFTSYIDAWNHAAPNFKRILKEGLDGYEARVCAMKDEDLKEALTDLLAGIRAYHARVLEHLQAAGSQQKLIDALRKVPFAPAESAYEALVACNFVLCLDGCDNIGFIDGWLPDYWKGEDLTQDLRCLFRRLLNTGTWSMTIGPVYTDLTKQYLKASEGMVRPMIELRTLPDMPDDIWQAALERVLSGNGQPAFYNEAAIQTRLQERFPDAPAEDIYEFAGMGCTETNLSGMTMSGGIDLNLNVLKVLDTVMREQLADCKSFEDFYEIFMARLHRAQDDLTAYITNYNKKRGEISFAPIRTLFTDDCIEREQGFFAGGARYTFATPSDSGIPNAADSLLAIRELIYEKKLYTPADFIRALDVQDVLFLKRLRTCPAYGTGNRIADELIHDLTHRFYAHYRRMKPDYGMGFLPTSHQFVRHIPEGKAVGPTPDGRRAYTPVTDSIAAVNGKAAKGPTMMLSSAAAYDQTMVYSIPVLNLSITRKFSPQVLRSLIEGYFEMGGTQIQITCTTPAKLLAAKANPEKHRDLIVRVGGYSEYFYRLSDELQDAVIERTLFEQ